MDIIGQVVENLTVPDNRLACGAMKLLLDESGRSDAVYPYFERFAAMLEHPNSYVRNRALLLLAANARWDGAHRFDGVIGAYLAHILDPKPITAR